MQRDSDIKRWIHVLKVPFIVEHQTPGDNVTRVVLIIGVISEINVKCKHNKQQASVHQTRNVHSIPNSERMKL